MKITRIKEKRQNVDMTEDIDPVSTGLIECELKLFYLFIAWNFSISLRYLLAFVLVDWQEGPKVF